MTTADKALEQAIGRLRIEVKNGSLIETNTKFPNVNIVGALMKRLNEDIGLLLAAYDESQAKIEIFELNEKMETGQI